MNTYWGNGGIAPCILNLSTRRRGAVSFTLRPLYHRRERGPRANWTRGWVDPRTGLDALARRKNSSPCRQSNPCRLARSLETTPTELPRFSLEQGWPVIITQRADGAISRWPRIGETREKSLYFRNCWIVVSYLNIFYRCTITHKR
jgi:hypothetical protein